MNWLKQLEKRVDNLNKMNAECGIEHEYEIILVSTKNYFRYTLKELMENYNDFKELKEDFLNHGKIEGAVLTWNEEYLFAPEKFVIEFKEIR